MILRHSYITILILHIMIVIDIIKNLIIYVACKIYRIMDGEE